MLLRGCVAARLMPNEPWLREFFEQSSSKLRAAGGPQLAEIGYALACMQLLPPPRWLHEYRQALGRRADQRQMGSLVSSERAALALQAFGDKDLSKWCMRLRVQPPPDLPGLAPVHKGDDLQANYLDDPDAAERGRKGLRVEIEGGVDEAEGVEGSREDSFNARLRMGSMAPAAVSGGSSLMSRMLQGWDL